jgi:hypothetical protein
VVLVLAGSGCFAPEPVVRMTPLSKNLFWVKGTQVAAVQGKTGRAAVAFLRDYNSQVSFRVEVENTSLAPLLVDPATFYYSTCPSAEMPAYAKCSTSRWVINPEQVLLDLDAQRSRDSASNNNASAFFMPFILLDAMAAVTGAAKGNGRMTAHALASGVETAAILDHIEATEQAETASYQSERSLWETGAFRKTTLFPGQRASGMVFIPHDLDCKSVRLHIRMGDEIVVFPFQQTLYDVRFR